MKNLRIAILGDPHFHEQTDKDANKVSYNTIGPTDETPWKNLIELMQGEGESVDIIICVGDLTTNANRKALTYGWDQICKLGCQLNASLIVSTAGNHDIFSRTNASTVAQDPVANLDKIVGMFEPLKLLTPTFPLVEINQNQYIEQPEKRTEYFGNAFSYYENSIFRVITLNSCSEHGHDECEYQKGTIPLSTRRLLEKHLASGSVTKDSKFNLFVCHHPPHPQSNFENGNHDFIENGDQMIKILEKFDDNWIIFHGHKHHSQICYARGNSSPPIVFSAASLGIINDPIKNEMKNQFYIVDLKFENEKVFGKVNAWNWASGQKWKPATPIEGGIYNTSGFGNRRTAQEIVKQIKEVHDRNNKLNLSWSEFLTEIPDIAYVTPETLNIIKDRLSSSYKLLVNARYDGFWESIEKERII